MDRQDRQVKCESCDQYYPATRSKCPHCGAKRQISSRRSGGLFAGNRSIIIGTSILVVLIVIVIVIVVRSFGSSDDDGTFNGDASPMPSGQINEAVSADPSASPSDEPLFPVEEITAEAITLIDTEFLLTVGAYFDLVPILSPLDATTAVIFSSVNPEIATVDPETGNVKGVGEGTTTIAAFAGSAQATCTVTVIGQSFTPGSSGNSSGSNSGGTIIAMGKLSNADFTLSKSDNKKYGKTYTLKLDGHTDGEYYSNNTKVATVSERGVVTAIGKGHTTIKVTYNGAEYIAEVHVID
jgi:hypothetical protein